MGVLRDGENGWTDVLSSNHRMPSPTFPFESDVFNPVPSPVRSHDIYVDFVGMDSDGELDLSDGDFSDDVLHASMLLNDVETYLTNGGDIAEVFEF